MVAKKSPRKVTQAVKKAVDQRGQSSTFKWALRVVLPSIMGVSGGAGGIFLATHDNTRDITDLKGVASAHSAQISEIERIAVKGLQASKDNGSQLAGLQSLIASELSRRR